MLDFFHNSSIYLKLMEEYFKPVMKALMDWISKETTIKDINLLFEKKDPSLSNF